MIARLKRILKNWVANDNTNRAAAIAFYALFSFSPLLVLSFNLSNLFLDKDFVKQEIINEVSALISPEAANLINSIFNYSGSIQLSSSLVSLLILFYASSKIFSALRSSFNVIFLSKPESHREKFFHFLKGQLISFILVPSTCLLFFISLSVNMFINNSNEYFAKLITDNHTFIYIASHSISLIVLALVSFLLIKFLPARQISNKAALIGACVSAIFFELGKFAISLYLSLSFIANFYGSMNSLVIIMLWIYYSVQILLLGAQTAKEFIKELEF